MTKFLLFILAMLCTVSLLSCSADTATDVFETAQFEELQNNNEHAQQLYEEIIRKYPQSDAAKKARERLTAMGKTDNE